MAKCSACGQEVEESHFEEIDTERGTRKKCPVKNRWAKLVREDEEQEDTRGEGALKGGGIDRYTRKIKDKVNTVISWLESGPIGVKPDSKNTKFLIDWIRDHPSKVDDHRELESWIKDMTEAKDLAVDGLFEQLEKIEEKYGDVKSPSERGYGSEGNEEVAREIKQLRREMKQEKKEKGTVSPKLKEKLYEKSFSVLDNLDTLGTLFGVGRETIRTEFESNPKFRSWVIERMKGVFGKKRAQELVKVMKEGSEFGGEMQRREKEPRKPSRQELERERNSELERGEKPPLRKAKEKAEGSGRVPKETEGKPEREIEDEEEIEESWGGNVD